MIAPLSHTSRMFEHSMKTYKIAAIPGDGIGKEVIAAGIEVLEALAARATAALRSGSIVSTGARIITSGTAS